MKKRRLLLVLRGRGVAALPRYLVAGVAAENAKRAYYPKGALSQALSYVDHTGNQDATELVAPTWDIVNGWKFNAQALNTGWIPSGSTNSFIIGYSDLGGENYMCGIATTPKLAIYHTSLHMRYQVGTSDQNVTPKQAAGYIAICGTKVYRSGVDEGLTLDANLTGNLLEFYIGMANLAGAPQYGGAKNVQYFLGYNIILTQAQVVGLVAKANP